MKKDGIRDYTKMTQIAALCGMTPYLGRNGKVEEGRYALVGKQAPVDLSACAEDKESILKTALQQLSEQVDEAWHIAVEKSFLGTD